MSNEDFQKVMLSTLKEIQTEITGMKTEITEIKTEQKAIRIQLDENTQILKALEHKAEVNKSEHDLMMVEIAKINGTTQEIKQNIIEVENQLIKIDVITATNNLEIIKLKKVK